MPMTAPSGPPTAAPTASPVTAPMSDCLEPSPGRPASSPAYTGTAVLAARNTPSAPARRLALTAFMVNSSWWLSRERAQTVPSTATTSAPGRAREVLQKRTRADHLWRTMAARAHRIYCAGRPTGNLPCASCSRAGRGSPRSPCCCASPCARSPPRKPPRRRCCARRSPTGCAWSSCATRSRRWSRPRSTTSPARTRRRWAFPAPRTPWST